MPFGNTLRGMVGKFAMLASAIHHQEVVLPDSNSLINPLPCLKVGQMETLRLLGVAIKQSECFSDCPWGEKLNLYRNKLASSMIRTQG